LHLFIIIYYKPPGEAGGAGGAREIIEIPDLPQAFKNKDMKDLIKGLFTSKYFIG
jgi:hypothetical protein